MLKLLFLSVISLPLCSGLQLHRTDQTSTRSEQESSPVDSANAHAGCLGQLFSSAGGVPAILDCGAASVDSVTSAIDDIAIQMTTGAFATDLGGIPRANSLSNVAKMEWKDLSYSVNNADGQERKILKNLSGKLMPGTLTGILGPSGSG